MQAGYVLEVLEYCSDTQERIRMHGEARHMGYMDAVFGTQKQAAEYYAMYNPHMRRLEVFGTWCSDYDPNTSLLYIVCENYGQSRMIPPFNAADNPVVVNTNGRSYPSWKKRVDNWKEWEKNK
jgi:hypothetical protein